MIAVFTLHAHGGYGCFIAKKNLRIRAVCVCETMSGQAGLEVKS